MSLVIDPILTNNNSTNKNNNNTITTTTTKNKNKKTTTSFLSCDSIKLNLVLTKRCLNPYFEMYIMHNKRIFCFHVVGRKSSPPPLYPKGLIQRSTHHNKVRMMNLPPSLPSKNWMLESVSDSIKLQHETFLWMSSSNILFKAHTGLNLKKD